MSLETLSILAAIYTSVSARGTWPTAEEVDALIGVDVEALAELEREGLLAPGIHGKARLRLTGHGKLVLLEAAGRAAA